MTTATNIVRMEIIRNQTPTGRASATVAKRLANAFAYGPGAQKEERAQQGDWYGPAGEPVTHQAVLDWVAREGKTKAFTYQFILSIKYVHLSPAEYGQAMHAGGALFPEWCLIVHRDTDYSHAHALAFGDEEIRIKSRAFRDWWQRTRAELDRLQSLYATEEIVQERQQEIAAKQRRLSELR
jgi:hypothetical protein